MSPSTHILPAHLHGAIFPLLDSLWKLHLLQNQRRKRELRDRQQRYLRLHHILVHSLLCAHVLLHVPASVWVLFRSEVSSSQEVDASTLEEVERQ